MTVPRPTPRPAAAPAGERPVPDAVRGRAVKPLPRQPEGEVGGPRGPEPTRFGDWEKGGRCTDF
jgi:hypothetical protein